jgi:hypothetical protein
MRENMSQRRLAARVHEEIFGREGYKGRGNRPVQGRVTRSELQGDEFSGWDHHSFCVFLKEREKLIDDLGLAFPTILVWKAAKRSGNHDLNVTCKRRVGFDRVDRARLNRDSCRVQPRETLLQTSGDQALIQACGEVGIVVRHAPSRQDTRAALPPIHEKILEKLCVSCLRDVSSVGRSPRPSRVSPVTF